jgi:hypothetical protein
MKDETNTIDAGGDGLTYDKLMEAKRKLNVQQVDALRMEVSEGTLMMFTGVSRSKAKSFLRDYGFVHKGGGIWER